MLDVTFLEALTKLAQKAAEPKVFNLPHEPEHRYAVRTPEGELDFREAEPEPRNHTALDLSALVEFAVDFTNTHAEVVKGEAVPANIVELWFSRHGVTLHLDSTTRRDVVRLKLEESPQLKTLRALENARQGVTQKEFIKLLRISLPGALPESMLNAVRNLKFKLNSEGESAVAHNKVSVGKAIQAQLDGSDVIPEEATAWVPIWTGFLQELPYGVRCAVDIDPQAQTFSLIPLPGEIERVVRDAEKKLGRLLAEAVADEASDPKIVDLIPVLYGVP